MFDEERNLVILSLFFYGAGCVRAGGPGALPAHLLPPHLALGPAHIYTVPFVKGQSQEIFTLHPIRSVFTRATLEEDFL